VAELSPTEREDVLVGAAGLARPLLAVGKDESAHSTASRDPFALVHGAYWLCANLAERGPLVLVIDDAHLADRESLLCLAYVARRLGGLPVLLTVAVRDNEPESSGAELNAVRAAPEARVLRPCPLSHAGSAALVRDVLPTDPDETFCRACHEATGGNPFLLSELATELAGGALEPVAAATRQIETAQPERVRRSVATRMARLGSAARALARAAAILGEDVELRHAVALARLDNDDGTEAADELVAAGLVIAERPLRFTHPLVRTAVYLGVPSARRAELHRRTAALLFAEDAAPERIAAHLLETEPAADQWSAARLRDAGQRALERGAAKAAVSYFARAFAEPPPAELRPALLRELGSAETRTGADAGIEHLEVALETTCDPRARAEVAQELALALTTFGRTSEAIEILQAAIDVLGDADRELALGLEGDLFGYAQLDLSTFGLLSRRLGGRQDKAVAATPGERVLLAYRALAHSLAGGTIAEAGDIAERALGEGRLLEEQTADAVAFYAAVHVLIDAERFDLVDAALDQALDDARCRGSLLGFAIASTQRSDAAYLRGRLDEAEMEVRAALEAGREAGWQVGLPITVSCLIDVLVERGELEEAGEVLDEADMSGEPPELLAFDWLLFSRARLRLATGATDRGLADLFELRDRHSRSGVQPFRFPWRTAVVAPLVARGERERALSIAEEEIDFMLPVAALRNRGMALRALGVATGGERGLVQMRQAAELLRESPARLEHARTLVDLGAALRRANRRSEARQQLDEGRSLAERCSAHALSERAREELGALGVRTRRGSATGVDALTPSERRVARMAAEGMSNPQIAQALFVTRKTIEKHLGSAYSKLDIPSRDLLPALVAELRPDPE
jgi:DNA-binding CsgD family transcriptional regulator